jgi:hypothetical protein
MLLQLRILQGEYHIIIRFIDAINEDYERII